MGRGPEQTLLPRRHKNKGGMVDDRGYVHPSDDQIKVVMETRSKQQWKITWYLDEKVIQLGRNPRKHHAMAEDRMGEDTGLPSLQRLSETEAGAVADTS